MLPRVPLEETRMSLDDRFQGTPMSSPESVAFIISADFDLRQMLLMRMSTTRIRVASARSAAEYFRVAKPDGPACLLVDVDLPDMNGLDFLRKTTTDAPAVMISRHSEVRTSVEAIKAGAVDFLTTPIESEALLHAVHIALERDRQTRARRFLREQLKKRFQGLSQREREAAALIVRGLRNKHIAEKLGISMVTVQIHRGNVMRKMGADSLAELVRMADMLGIDAACEPGTFSNAAIEWIHASVRLPRQHIKPDPMIRGGRTGELSRSSR
jgi:FixJ family two-component response regulator